MDTKGEALKIQCCGNCEAELKDDNDICHKCNCVIDEFLPKFKEKKDDK